METQEVLHAPHALHKAGALDRAHSRGGHLPPRALIENKGLVGHGKDKGWAGWLRATEFCETRNRRESEMKQTPWQTACRAPDGMGAL